MGPTTQYPRLQAGWVHVKGNWTNVSLSMSCFIIGFFMFSYGAHLILRYDLGASSCRSFLSSRSGARYAASGEVATMQKSMVTCGVLLVLLGMAAMGIQGWRFHKSYKPT